MSVIKKSTRDMFVFFTFKIKPVRIFPCFLFALHCKGFCTAWMSLSLFCLFPLFLFVLQCFFLASQNGSRFVHDLDVCLGTYILYTSGQFINHPKSNLTEHITILEPHNKEMDTFYVQFKKVVPQISRLLNRKMFGRELASAPRYTQYDGDNVNLSKKIHPKKRDFFHSALVTKAS